MIGWQEANSFANSSAPEGGNDGAALRPILLEEIKEKEENKHVQLKKKGRYCIIVWKA